MKSGKYCLGYKQTLKTLRQGKAKLIIIANNTPHLRWDSRWKLEIRLLRSSSFPFLRELTMTGTIWSHFGDWEVWFRRKRYGVICGSTRFYRLVSKLVPYSRFRYKITQNPSWFSLENPKSSTTLCWPRPESTTTTATTSSSEQLAVNTSASAPSQSLMLEIPISSAHCQKPRPATTKMFFMNWTWIFNKKVLKLKMLFSFIVYTKLYYSFGSS